MAINDNKQALTWEMARPIVAQKAKQFEAAMTPDVAAGRYRPVGYGAWMGAVAADFGKQPKLVECALQAPESVWECLGVAANSGLLPGSAYGQFYLIPRWNGRNQRMECTYIIGYRGMSELAMRHPRVHKCEAFVVYKGEPFEFHPGSGKLVHQCLPVNHSDENVVAAYSRVVLTVGEGGTVTDPEPLVWVMWRDDLLKTRDRSDGWKAFKNGKTKDTPWASDFAAMCRKTAMRRHFSGGSIPRSNDLLMAVASEIEHEEREREVEVPTTTEVAQKANAGLRNALGLTPEPESITLPKKEFDPIDEEFERHAEHQARLESDDGIA